MVILPFESKSEWNEEWACNKEDTHSRNSASNGSFGGVLITSLNASKTIRNLLGSPPGRAAAFSCQLLKAYDVIGYERSEYNAPKF